MTTPAPLKPCPFCAEPIQVAAVRCHHCASSLVQDAAPPAGGVQALIPTSNPPALLAYYAAVFSVIPIFGLLLGPLAVVLGVVGLSKLRADPRLSGTAHAWIGIALGGVVSLAYAALVVAMLA